MTLSEATEFIEMAISKIEWEHPMDYSAAIDLVIKIPDWLKLPETVLVSCTDPENMHDNVRVRCGDCIKSVRDGKVYICSVSGRYVPGNHGCTKGVELD